MKVNDWLKKSIKILERAGISTARLDALVLLEDATNNDKSYLLAHPEHTLPPTLLNSLNKRLKRRQNYEPLAYIRGKSEFYGREFIVSKDTLQPRPETETMISLLKELITNSQKPPLKEDSPLTERGNVNWQVMDVGTGSGCIGITVKLEFPEAEVMATEINLDALKIAKQNAKKLDAKITFYSGDLLKPLPDLQSPDILLCNLPYVPDSHTINQAAMQEPKIAIFGGPDGLDIYRRVFMQIANLSQKPRYVFTESLPFQHEELATIAKRSGYAQQTEDDFIQLFML